ncbi:MAG: hypothetical protein ACXQTD_07065, partial [Candidatus Syntropharchaeia archaeon]
TIASMPSTNTFFIFYFLHILFLEYLCHRTLRRCSGHTGMEERIYVIWNRVFRKMEQFSSKYTPDKGVKKPVREKWIYLDKFESVGTPWVSGMSCETGG